MAFWGQVSTDATLKRLNAWVHREYVAALRASASRALARGAPLAADRCGAQVLQSIMTFINGLTASAVTSPARLAGARARRSSCACNWRCCDAGPTGRRGHRPHALASRDRRTSSKPTLRQRRHGLFSLTDEQQLVIKTTREFVERELYPHEARGRTHGRPAPRAASASSRPRRSRPACTPRTCRPTSAAAGSTRSRGRCTKRNSVAPTTRCTTAASAGRPTSCSRAQGEQRERYLLPAVRGERIDCLAMSEPGAGSDLRSMTHDGGRAGRATSSSTAPSTSSATPTTPTS